MSSQQQQASSASTASSDPLFADRTKHYWNVRMQDKKVQATDGQSLPREVHMSAHKQRLMDFKKANPGVIQFGGPTYDDTTGRPNGSSFILRRHPDFFPERSDVEEWVEQDAYWKNQVWERRDIALFVGLTTPQKPA